MYGDNGVKFIKGVFNLAVRCDLKQIFIQTSTKLSLIRLN
jgi:hypothetical protein